MLLRALIIVFCLAVLGASMVLFARDYRTAFSLRGTTNYQIASLTDPDYKAVSAVSARTLRDLMSNCSKLTTLAPALKANPELAETVRQRCASVADEVIQTSPSNARGRALAVLTAPKLLAVDLAVAQRIAPFEPWPLATRLAAIAAAQSLAPDVEPLAMADFSRALLSFWGRSEVTKLYVQHSRLRPLIQAALASLPPDDQANFIRLARQTLANVH